MSWIFDFDDYRKVLNAMIDKAETPHGYRSLLARAAGCQPAYLSQVLAARANLTLEQGINLSDFWSLDKYESEYFLVLVQLGKAGTERLRQQLVGNLKSIVSRSKILGGKIVDEQNENSDATLIYYSNWKVSAIHVLISVEALRTVSALSMHLKVSEDEVEKTLQSLLEIGLAYTEDGKWFQTMKRLHARDVYLSAQLHHKNWRLQASNNIDKNNSTNLHFTTVCTLSEKDYQEIRALMMQAVRDTQNIIDPSREETGACLLIDWFKI